ncbi:fliM [Acrasis kona]|uniref:FliM n=1 Tax=Acrasis kona TaxID=1008807 RepID=A0AAW2YXG0_9EUKA
MKRSTYIKLCKTYLFRVAVQSLRQITDFGANEGDNGSDRRTNKPSKKNSAPKEAPDKKKSAETKRKTPDKIDVEEGDVVEEPPKKKAKSANRVKGTQKVGANEGDVSEQVKGPAEADKVGTYDEEASVGTIIDKSDLILYEDKEPYKQRLTNNRVRTLKQWKLLSADKKKEYFSLMLIKVLDAAAAPKRLNYGDVEASIKYFEGITGIVNPSVRLQP